MQRTDWHIFRCGHASRVRDIIMGKGLSAMAPYTQSFEAISRSKMVSRTSPVFPGYVFVELTPKQLSLLYGIPFLWPHPLAFEGEPYRMLVPDVSFIRSLCESPPLDPRAPQPLPAPTPYMAGEAVDIIEGPFAGFTGEVEASDAERVKVLTSLFGRMTPLTLDHAAVRRA